MFVLRFTQALLKDMKAIPENIGEDVPLLFSWHVHMIKLNNRKHIIFVNDLTRLCIIIDGIRSSQLDQMKEKFRMTLRTYLQSTGVDSSLMDSYLEDGSTFAISKTNNRSVLGTMKEISIYDRDRFTDPMERMKWLNKLIYKPINYNNPNFEFQNAIRRQYLNE